jgi:protein-S-isoprenylcysteine O-methyltransferase Ste14
MKRTALYVLGQFALFAVMLAALLLFPLGSDITLRIVGSVLIGFGALVVLLGIMEHQARNRRLPSVTPEPNQNAELVDTGIYRHIRHPLYSGVILAAFGVALAHGHIVPIVVAAVIAVFFTFKSRFEESLLRQAYPDYAAYMRRTGRFLPGL